MSSVELLSQLMNSLFLNSLITHLITCYLIINELKLFVKTALVMNLIGSYLTNIETIQRLIKIEQKNVFVETIFTLKFRVK